MTQDAGEIFPGITVDPQVMHGKPVLAGTRIPAALIIGQLAAGETFESLEADYHVTAEQIQAALAFAAARWMDPHQDPRT